MEKQLHVITTGKERTEQIIRIAREIHSYITALHIREKTITAKELTMLLKQLESNGVPMSKIIINDRVDVAVCCQAKGVQLGFRSLDTALVRAAFPGLMIGCSVHCLEEVRNAEQNGADFLFYGHIFPTESKRDQDPRGIDQLQYIVEQSTLPVIAIGGVQPENVREVLQTGAAGIAVLSGIMEAESPLKAVKAYKRELEVFQ
ncbi:thiamine phosphate synthase [Fictibacillus sp. BK138]|uniref:thiamine phosphate synthase n=1 Tax=Fictibacillus sp. BK138 TaxID=2512121 RepID=UPI00102919F9|nr:thiamine phosphate synthase [Fictibacillus sp. BK138]RZT21271.1 thiazole tautomerase (transcriptional regulator TenI) [Fictibacillus sp. BK138]